MEWQSIILGIGVGSFFTGALLSLAWNRAYKSLLSAHKEQTHNLKELAGDVAEQEEIVRNVERLNRMLTEEDEGLKGENRALREMLDKKSNHETPETKKRNPRKRPRNKDS